MFNSTKARIQRGREFVSTHQSLITHTAVASTAAAVSYKLANQRTNAACYLLGREVIVARMLGAFIEEQDLVDQFKEFAPKFVEKYKS